MQNNHKLLAVACMLAASSMAQAQIYKVTLSGASENPPVATNASGSAIVTINTTSHELRVKANFSGLNGPTTASHIHCCTAPTGNAGVVTATPSFAGFPNGVTSGNFDRTYDTTLASSWNASAITNNGGTPAGAEAAFARGVDAGQAYLNIHTSFAPGGEIRGTLQAFSFVSAARPVTVGAARALDSLGAGTGAVNERLVAMAMSSTAEQSTALLSLLPVPGQVISTISSNTLFADYDQIGNRLGGLRDPDNANGTGFWIKAADHDAEQDLNRRGISVDSDGWDVMGGADLIFGPNTLIGAAIGVSEDDLSYGGNLRNEGSVDGWRVTAYGEHRMGIAFIDAMITYAQHDIDSVRNTGGGAASGSTEADQWGARWTGGLRLDVAEGVLFTPQIRLDGSSVDIDGYQESGGGLPLHVGSQSENRLRASLGGQLDFSLSDTIKPYVRAFWGSELKDDDSVTVAGFAAGGNAFNTSDEGLENSGYMLGVGLNVLNSETFGAAVSYDRVDGDNYQSDFIQGKIYFRF